MELALPALQNKIMSLPHRPRFMLDNDVATVYGVSTRQLNQAANRNIDRFPDDFRFQLAQDEFKELVINCDQFKNSKITNCDLRGKHRKYIPYAYTREGCNMLAAVLHTPFAVQRSVQIMRAFSAIEREIETGAAFGRFTSLVKELTSEISGLKADVAYLKRRPQVAINLPDDEALPISLERRICHRKKHSILRNQDAFSLAVDLLSNGAYYFEVAEKINQTIPGFKTSKSAIHRFWVSYRRGDLKRN